MKFYNPFKPHIVKLGDSYAVRRLTTLTTFAFLWYMWEYRDTKDRYWWSSPNHVRNYSLSSSLEQSRALLKRIRPVLPKSEYLES